MEIKIEAADVNRMVADAVLNSAIGDAVKAEVAKSIESFTRSYGNPLANVINTHVSQIVREVLVKEHGDKIRERIKAALATKLSDEFIDQVCNYAVKDYER